MTKAEALEVANSLASDRNGMGHGHTLGPDEVVDLLEKLGVVKFDEAEIKALPAPETNQ